MPRNLPLPTILSPWGEKWQNAWQLLGILDGRRHAVRRAHGYIVNDATKMGAWRILWEYMFFQVLNTNREIDGFSTAFAQDCFIMWQYGYNTHHSEWSDMAEDCSMQTKGRLLQDLWWEFLEDEPPEFDRYWL